MPITLDFFSRVVMPARLLSSEGGLLYFATKQARVEDNDYRTRHWLCQKGKPKPMLLHREARVLGWQDEGLLCVAAPSATEKKWAGQGLDTSTIQWLDVREPGRKPVDLFRLPYFVEQVVALQEQTYLVQVQWSAKIQQALDAGDEPQAALQLQSQQAWTRVQRLPIWENGGSYLDGKVSRLGLWQQGKWTWLTPPHTQVEQVEAQGDFVYYIAQDEAQLGGLANRVWQQNWKRKKAPAVEIFLGEDFRHDRVVPLPQGGVLLTGSDGKRSGINQNPSFYRWDEKKGVTVLEDSGRYCDGSSLLTDIHLSAPAKILCREDKAYWITTLGQNSHCMELDLGTGAIRQLTRTDGAVCEIALAPQGLYISALRQWNGAEIYLLDQQGEEKPITRLQKDLWAAHSRLPAQPLQVKTPDGEMLDGYVLLPPGAKNCPVVLYVHGGPKMAYGNLLFHEMQVLAQRGYGVVLCNPRGSEGKGDAFADIRGQYGKRDCQDLLCFLEGALAAFPLLNREKIGLLGGSYGGYITNWLIAHTGRFAAAVSQRSISNWISMGLLSDIGPIFAPDQAGNDLVYEKEELWDNSPLKYVHQVKTPTLFIHSSQDYRCPLPEAMQMFTSLQLQGVDTELVVFHEENHDLSRSGRPQNRITRLGEICRWLDRYLQ